MMKPDITILTCTRDSPICMRLCERWVSQQTYKGSMQWLVSDDGDEPASLTMGQEHIRRKRQSTDPSHTLGENIRAALPYVDGKVLLLIEHDDAYGPNYIQAMWDIFNRSSVKIAGTSHALKYNARDRRWWRNNSAIHSSLCSTGITRELIPVLNEVARTHNPFCDLEIWRRHLHEGHLVPSLDPHWFPVCVGMKCVPGFTSTATMNGRISRMPRATNGHADPNLSKLREWIGDDAEHYRPFGAK